MKIGELDIIDAYVGTTSVSKIFLGTELVWPKDEHYVKITAPEDN